MSRVRCDGLGAERAGEPEALGDGIGDAHPLRTGKDGRPGREKPDRSGPDHEDVVALANRAVDDMDGVR